MSRSHCCHSLCHCCIDQCCPIHLLAKVLSRFQLSQLLGMLRGATLLSNWTWGDSATHLPHCYWLDSQRGHGKASCLVWDIWFDCQVASQLLPEFPKYRPCKQWILDGHTPAILHSFKPRIWWPCLTPSTLDKLVLPNPATPSILGLSMSFKHFDLLERFNVCVGVCWAWCCT